MNAVGESGGWLRRHSGRQKASPGRKKQTQLQEGQESQKIKVPNMSQDWSRKLLVMFLDQSENYTASPEA